MRITADTTTFANVLVNPTSITVTVFKGSTTVLAATPMVTTGETGKYYYNWQIGADLAVGKYETKFTAVRNARTSIEHDERAFYLY